MPLFLTFPGEGEAFATSTLSTLLAACNSAGPAAVNAEHDHGHAVNIAELPTDSYLGAEAAGPR